MIHALYFKKDADGSSNVVYNRRYVETETLKIETQRNKPSFLPATEGDFIGNFVCLYAAFGGQINLTTSF